MNWKNIKNALSIKLKEKGDKAIISLKYNKDFLKELKEQRIILGKEEDDVETNVVFGNDLQRYKASTLLISTLQETNTYLLLAKELIDKGYINYSCTIGLENYERFIIDAQKAIVKMIKILFVRKDLSVSYTYREREKEVEVNLI